MTRQMKITILNDNIAGRWYGAEHGLSFLVEAGITFLFDVGPSDIIIRNANILGIDLGQIKTIVLSHAHNDHTGGLKFLKGQQLVCHPGVFDGHFRKDGTSNGIPFSLNEAMDRFDLKASQKPLWLSEDVAFLGEIPRNNNFESKETPFVNGQGEEDFILDDSAMAVVTSKGLVIIAGCSHAGICNTVDYAREVTGIIKIEAIVGGLHLGNNNGVTKKTIEYLSSIGVGKVIPSHCTSFEAQTEFYKLWALPPLKTGQVLEFN